MITEKDSKAVSDYLRSGAFITEYKQTRECTIPQLFLMI